MTRDLVTVLFVCAAVTLQAQPLAWMKLGEPGGQTYEGSEYHWLGDAALHLAADVTPAEGHALDLLWGSKNDRRGADVTINGTSRTVQAGGYTGFKWQRVDVPAGVVGERYEIVVRGAAPKAAFFAAVRLVPVGSPLDGALPQARSQAMRLTEAPPHPLQAWMDELQADETDVWQRATIHGAQANEALRRCRRYVDGWLAHADPRTGLIPRNLGSGKHFWNGRDAGADNYAFMVLTCALTDRAMFDGRMLDMLRTETTLTSRIGALPADQPVPRVVHGWEERWARGRDGRLPRCPRPGRPRQWPSREGGGRAGDASDSEQVGTVIEQAYSPIG